MKYIQKLIRKKLNLTEILNLIYERSLNSQIITDNLDDDFG